MYCNNYVAVGKADEGDWSILKPLVIDTLTDHFTKNLDLFEQGYTPGESEVSE